MKPIVYFDMDDVLVDFNSSKRIPESEKTVYNHKAIYDSGFFFELKPMPGAISLIKKLTREDKWDIHILTQPVAKSHYSYSEKMLWVEKYFPELVHKIHMTQDKLLFKGHLLVDDNPKWSNFEGHFFLFNKTLPKAEFLILSDYMDDLYNELCE